MRKKRREKTGDLGRRKDEGEERVWKKRCGRKFLLHLRRNGKGQRARDIGIRPFAKGNGQGGRRKGTLTKNVLPWGEKKTPAVGQQQSRETKFQRKRGGGNVYQ